MDGQSVGQLTTSVENGGAILGIGRDSMYDLVKAGKIRSIRIGRKIRIPVAELERFLEREAGT